MAGWSLFLCLLHAFLHPLLVLRISSCAPPVLSIVVVSGSLGVTDTSVFLGSCGAGIIGSLGAVDTPVFSGSRGAGVAGSLGSVDTSAFSSLRGAGIAGARGRVSIRGPTVGTTAVTGGVTAVGCVATMAVAVVSRVLPLCFRFSCFLNFSTSSIAFCISMASSRSISSLTSLSAFFNSILSSSLSRASSGVVVRTGGDVVGAAGS